MKPKEIRLTETEVCQALIDYIFKGRGTIISLDEAVFWPYPRPIIVTALETIEKGAPFDEYGYEFLKASIEAEATEEEWQGR